MTHRFPDIILINSTAAAVEFETQRFTVSYTWNNAVTPKYAKFKFLITPITLFIICLYTIVSMLVSMNEVARDDPHFTESLPTICMPLFRRASAFLHNSSSAMRKNHSVSVDRALFEHHAGEAFVLICTNKSQDEVGSMILRGGRSASAFDPVPPECNVNNLLSQGLCIPGRGYPPSTPCSHFLSTSATLAWDHQVSIVGSGILPNGTAFISTPSGSASSSCSSCPLIRIDRRNNDDGFRDDSTAAPCDGRHVFGFRSFDYAVAVWQRVGLVVPLLFNAVQLFFLVLYLRNGARKHDGMFLAWAQCSIIGSVFTIFWRLRSIENSTLAVPRRKKLKVCGVSLSDAPPDVHQGPFVFLEIAQDCLVGLVVPVLSLRHESCAPTKILVGLIGLKSLKLIWHMVREIYFWLAGKEQEAGHRGRPLANDERDDEKLMAKVAKSIRRCIKREERGRRRWKREPLEYDDEGGAVAAVLVSSSISTTATPGGSPVEGERVV